MKKTKERTFRYYTIKIDLARTAEEKGGGIYYNDKMFLVDIRDGINGMMFAVKCGKNHGANVRKLFREIQKELHLRK